MNSVEFAEWWFESGSGIVPLVDEDAHEHARRVAKAAWRHRQAEIDRLRDALKAERERARMLRAAIVTQRLRNGAES